MANSGPGWETVDIAWEAMQEEIREAQRVALEGDNP